MKHVILIIGLIVASNFIVEAQTTIYRNNSEKVLIGFGKSDTFHQSNVDFTVSNMGNGKYLVIFTDPIGDLRYIFTYTGSQVEGWYYYRYKSAYAQIDLAAQYKLSEIAQGKGGRIAWVHTSAVDTRSVLYDLRK